MPFGDGTGPRGMGPRTGRGAGFCCGYGVPGSMNAGFGRGLGMGRGRGGGWGNWFRAPGFTGRQRGFGRLFGWPFGGGAASPEPRDAELGALKAQAQGFESALAEIRERIEALEPKRGQE